MKKTQRRALPSPAPVKRSNLTALILGRLRDYVIDHDFSAGDRLPPERALAARLDVSRPSLRRALDWLDQRGALRRVQGGGTFLQTRFLPVFDNHVGGGQSLEVDPDELIEACSALAAGMMRLTAARVSSRDLSQLRTQLTTARIETDEDWREHELRFHRSLADMSGNSILAATLESLLSQAMASWTLPTEPDRLGDHHAIVDALSSGDVDTAVHRLQCCLSRGNSTGG